MVILSNDLGLAFCKLGDSSWTTLEDNDNPGLLLTPTDLAYSSEDQLFYCTDSYSDSDLDAWNLRNPCSPRRIDIKAGLVYGTPDYPESEKKLRNYSSLIQYRNYLAMESHSGDVLLVKRFVAGAADDGTIIDTDNSDHGQNFSFKTLRFDVSRFNTTKRGWDYVTDLGDGVLFVGLNHAFHLSATDFAPGVLIPNSIYFNVDVRMRCDDIGIYNMQDFTIKSIFPSHLHPFNNIWLPTPIWFTPNPENK
ncbi:uncharacterized protein LOC132272667 [Cornus florida]|uniref:uncharacterized protein LOC132272667 n=1 Tax=Cornus florida TaxID=4283 RepID=UPI0028A1C4F0|nr:uncharacterized protein LOC132272667 [Cornus florida]